MGKPLMDYNKMTNEEILQLFKEQYYKIKPKDATEYIKKCNMPSLYILKSRLGMKWSDVLIKIGARDTVQPLESYVERSKHKKEKTLNKYKNIFTTIYNELGYIPNTTECWKYNINPNAVRQNFKMTYKEFIIYLGFKEKDIKDTVKFIEFSDEQLIKKYRDLCVKIGKVATSRDIKINKDMPSTTSFLIRFGSMNKLKQISGIDELFNDKRKFTRHTVLKMLKGIYVHYERRLTTMELNKISKKDKEFPSNTAIFCCFKTDKISDIWEEVEKEMLKEYIKLLKNNKCK